MFRVEGNKYQCVDEYCPNSKKPQAIGEPMICQNCGKREATITWVGEGGTLAWVHGMGQEWCKLCCVKEQLKYAKKQAERIPELKEELRQLIEQEIQEAEDEGLYELSEHLTSNIDLDVEE